jgi:hypothetical protein
MHEEFVKNILRSGQKKKNENWGAFYPKEQEGLIDVHKSQLIKGVTPNSGVKAAGKFSSTGWRHRKNNDDVDHCLFFDYFVIWDL